MIYPSCRFENQKNAKFCNDCSATLVTVCNCCGQVNPPANKFCNECGRVLNPDGSEPPSDIERMEPVQSERKPATVLFSDLSGYIALGEKFDPEDVKEIMDRIFGGVAKVVAQYEGFIYKFMSEAVRVLEFSRKFGFEIGEEMGRFFLGGVFIAKDRMSLGMKMLQEGIKWTKENQLNAFNSLFHYSLGNLYLRIVQGQGYKSPLILARNTLFLIKHVPIAGRKAEHHLTTALEMARNIGAYLIEGRVLLDLGLLHLAKGKKDKAKANVSEASQAFTKIENEFYLDQAGEDLASLD